MNKTNKLNMDIRTMTGSSASNLCVWEHPVLS